MSEVSGKDDKLNTQEQRIYFGMLTDETIATKVKESGLALEEYLGITSKDNLRSFDEKIYQSHRVFIFKF